MLLRLRESVMSLEPGRPVVMGILNASPESFSDGTLAGRDLEAQVARGLGLAEAGAAIVDVGGESGVTHRPPLSVAEEVRRVVPLVERLTAAGVLVSIDTYKPAVARAALAEAISSGVRSWTSAVAQTMTATTARSIVRGTALLPSRCWTVRSRTHESTSCSQSSGRPLGAPPA